jgi:hypothetical protein
MAKYKFNRRNLYPFFFILFFADKPGTSFSQGSALPGFTADSVKVAAGSRYQSRDPLKKFILGSNYRKVWATPTTLPVFDLRSSGMTITELGGGMQTRSLRLVDKDSIEWVLRTVDKNVEEAIPERIRKRFVVKVVQDLVSAAHPYAPLIIPPLAAAARVPVAAPRIYFVPRDPAFGAFADIFGNTVSLLERRNVVPGVLETESTRKLFGKLLKDSDSETGQEIYLRARLLDMLIADWDRHYDQWRWLPEKKNGYVSFIPLPRDRDQALFYSDGLLVRLAKLFGLKHFVGFTRKTGNLRNLSAKSWNMDLMLMNQLNAASWEQTVTEFLDNLTDSVIVAAVKKLPKESYELTGRMITEKLISRRNRMKEDVMDYYRFLSRQVIVYGSDDAEIFHLSGNKDSVSVVVYKPTDSSRISFKRTFHKAETGTIQLVGLGGADQFMADRSFDPSIKIEVNAGAGDNRYLLPNNRKIKIVPSDDNAETYFAMLKTWLPIKE